MPEITTVHHLDVPESELKELDDRLADLVEEGLIDPDGELYGALAFIIDTLRGRKDVHLITVD